MPVPTSEFDFLPALSSAWNLCTAVAGLQLHHKADMCQFTQKKEHGVPITAMQVLSQRGTQVGPKALRWAIEIEEWSETIPIQKDILAYTTLLSMYEQCGQHRRVDDLLNHMATSGKVAWLMLRNF